MPVNMPVPACWPLDGLPGEFYAMSGPEYRRKSTVFEGA